MSATTLSQRRENAEHRAAIERARADTLGAKLTAHKNKLALKLISAAYEAGGINRRSAGWRTDRGSANVVIGKALPELRARSAELVENNPHAKKAVETLVTMLIGTGITHVSKYQDAWLRWVEVCDADGQHDLYGLQSLAVRTMINRGAALIRFRHRLAKEGLEVPLQLQVLEPDHIDLNKNGPNGTNTIIQGIEFDAIGRRVWYHLFQQHPGESWRGGGGPSSLVSKRVPAHDVIHLYRKNRTPQVHGVPEAHAVMMLARDIGDWDLAEIMAKKISACHVMAVRLSEDATRNPPDVVENPMTGEPEDIIVPGKVIRISGADEVIFNNPRAGADTSYRRDRLHDMAAGFNVTHEDMTGDMSQVNFSSLKAGLIQVRDWADSVQWITIIPMMCQAIDRRWVETAFLSGAIPAREYTTDFVPAGRPSIDKLKDVLADKEEIRGALNSISANLRKRGVVDPVQFIRDWAADLKFIREEGAVTDSDASHKLGSQELHEDDDASIRNEIVMPFRSNGKNLTQ